MLKKFLIGVFVFALLSLSSTALAYDFGTKPLKMGDRGEYVKTLQSFVGASPLDGIFGVGTKAKVMAWQKANGLFADGVFGPMSIAKANGVTSGNFPAGCTSASGFSITTGSACSSLQANTFSDGCKSASGFSTTTGLSCSNVGTFPLVVRGGGSTSSSHKIKAITDANVTISHGSAIFDYSFNSGDTPITYADAKKAPYYLDTDASTVTLQTGGKGNQSFTAYLKDLNISDDGMIEYNSIAELQADFPGWNNFTSQIVLHLEGATDVNSGKSKWTKDVTLDLSEEETYIFFLIMMESALSALPEADYTPESFVYVTEALALPETNSEEIAIKVESIMDIIINGRLVYLGQADLDEAMATANALSELDYSPSSWAVLQTAINTNVSSNAEVVAKTEAIYNAIDDLVSSVATLSITSNVKQAILDPDQGNSLGTPSTTIDGVSSSGFAAITDADAANQALTTHFVATNANATVKVVKYASGADTSGFASATAYNNENITNGDFFIVRVTAEDLATIFYYKVVIIVNFGGR